MNWKRFWLAALVVYIVLRITDFIVHGLILGGLYMSPALKGAFRPEAEMMGYMWVFWVTTIVFSFFFTFIFVKGYEGRGIMEGVRYGLYMGIFIWFTAAFAQFVTYSITYSLVWYWIIFGVIQMILCGIVAALIYKPREATA